MTNSVVVRAARPEEAPLLSTIARAAKARWGYPAQWVDAWHDELTLAAADVKRMFVYVADWADDGGHTVVGFVAIMRQGDGWSLEHLWVSPDAERRGVGSALFARVVREVGQAGGGTITILSDPNARAFYERLGARREGEVPAPMPGDGGRTLPRLSLYVAPVL